MARSLAVTTKAKHGFRSVMIWVGDAPDWAEGDTLSIMGGEIQELAAGMGFHLVPGILSPRSLGVWISETIASRSRHLAPAPGGTQAALT